MKANGLDFHVETGGRGSPLVLVHGFTGSVRSWDGVWPALSARANLVALDVIGHGRSAAPAEPERYTFDGFVRDLEAILDTLGHARADVLGYSMGGRLALYFAVQRPQRVRRLILESASPGIADPDERERRRAADAGLAQRILQDGIPAFVADWERQPLLAAGPRVSEAVKAAQHAQRLDNRALGLANSLRGMGAGQQPPVWARLNELDLPVWLIVGALDARYVAVAQHMRQRLPRAEVAVVSAAGHTVHIDRPDEFTRLVRQALCWPLQEIDTRRDTLLY